MLKKLQERYISRLKSFSFKLTIGTLFISSVIIFLVADDLITFQLGPELEKKSIVLSDTTLAPIERAVELGFELKSLRGVEEHFEDVMTDNKELLYVILTDKNGEILFSRGVDTDAIKDGIKEHQNYSEYISSVVGEYYNTMIPIEANGKIVGNVHLGVAHDIISRSIQDISYDALVVFLISLLVTFEILIFILQHRVSAPIEDIQRLLKLGSEGRFDIPVPIKSGDEIGQFSKTYRELTRKINFLYEAVKNKFELFEIQKEGTTALKKIKTRLNAIESKYSFFKDTSQIDSFQEEVRVSYIRTPLFMFVFAESLSIAFLPLFSNYIYVPIFGLPREFIIALPIIFFMMVYALSQPFSGMWANIASKRKIFIIGALVSAIGLLGSGLAFSVVDFLLWRMLTAGGYGMILIACQGYILDNTSAENRNQGMAIYISGFYSASVCGSAIGSILADGIGYRATFILSAFLALLSAGFVATYIVDYAKPKVQRVKVSWRSLRTMLQNKNFLSLVFLISIPSKIILASIIYYIVPLYLAEIGTRQSEIGRVIMVYGFIMLVLSPIAARFADKVQKPRMIISLGSVLSGLAIIPVFAAPGMWGLVFTVILLGLGHAMSLTAQVAIVPSLVKTETKELGAAVVTSIYRLLDIQGLVIGPAVAGILVANYDHITALTTMGVIVVALSTLFMVLTRGQAEVKPA